MNWRKHTTRLGQGVLLASWLAVLNPAFAQEAPVPPAFPLNAKWSLLVPAEGDVVFHGVVSFDSAGSGSVPIMYPAPSVGGFLAAVITHGLLMDSANNAQKDKLRKSADLVLEPYRSVLDGLVLQELMSQAATRSERGTNARVVTSAEQASDDTLVESVPIFSMTQDQKAIVLDNAVVIRSGGTTYQNMIRVISSAHEEADPLTFWTANAGSNLREELTRLIATSVDIGLTDASLTKQDDAPQRTVRYWEGGNERIERAQVLNERCGRLLIRNLRGVLMSVPASRNTALASAEGLCGMVGARAN